MQPFNNGLALKNSINDPFIFDEDIFKERLKENFTLPVFNCLSLYFSRKTWRGHIANPHSGLTYYLNPHPIMENEIKTFHGRFHLNALTADEREAEGQIALGNNEYLTYTFKRLLDITQMTSIIISIYGGFDEEFDAEILKVVPPLSLSDTTIGRIGLNLPDSILKIKQAEQLNERRLF